MLLILYSVKAKVHKIYKSSNKFLTFPLELSLELLKIHKKNNTKRTLQTLDITMVQMLEVNSLQCAI